jgi:nitrogen regulatory protein PII
MSQTATSQRLGGSLIITVMERGHGDKAVELTKKLGARGGTVMLGHSSSGNQFLDFLSIGEIENDILLTLVQGEELDPIMNGLREFKAQGKHRSGFVVVVEVANLFKPQLQGQIQTAALSFSNRSPTMNTEPEYSLIMFIVNKGYADDLMAAARKVGATGGTVLHARGTGKEEDVRFFGITLVPEKEILLIVAESSKSEAIVAALKAVPELNQAGAGIAIRIDAKEIFTLGDNPE